ncbi:MAG: HD domain-containing protein [Acidaminococcales bacterium]|jgi:HD superfamily phosphohydrolase YqeK|nr:HD domain-containing protein [Acidaminococcales bacterium]
MLDTDLSKLKAWFAVYIIKNRHGDSAANSAFDLKIHHTALVCDDAREIAQCLGWPPEAVFAAEAAALLHDVGRFPQMNKFHTFDDRRSVDHAALGVEAILEDNILAGLSGKEQRTIISAVQWHNKRFVPAELPEDEKPLLFLLRDADKLDIMRIFCDYYVARQEELRFVLEPDLPKAGGCSEKILSALDGGQTADINDARNVNDVRLIKLSWVYDLNYPKSRELFLKRRYIEKTLASLPPLPEIQSAGRRLARHLKANSR